MEFAAVAALILALVSAAAGLGAAPAVAQSCIGDCDGRGSVAISDLVRGVAIALGSVPADQCTALDANSDGAVAINELIEAVNNALAGQCEAVVRIVGSCARPATGPGRFAPCDDGTAIRAYSCAAHNNDCVQGGLREVLSEDHVYGGQGLWGLAIPSGGLPADTLLAFEADVDRGVVYRTLDFGVVGALGAVRAASAAGIATPPMIQINPVTEASVRLIAGNGLENFSNQEIASVFTAVDQATADVSFAGVSPADAASLATEVAGEDPVVMMVIESAVPTPTPTGDATASPSPTPTITLTEAQGRRLQTGQTTCYEAGGAVIACDGTGQDGELQEGLTRAYVDNGDGTITDTRTGLMWEKLSDDDSIHDQDDSYTWTDAFATKIAALNDAHFAGHDDWRLPNVNELQSLVNYGTFNPAVDGPFNTSCAPSCTITTCSCTQPDVLYYWSSTSWYLLPSYARAVDVFFGFVLTLAKADARHVRAVRAAPLAAPPGQRLQTGLTTCYDAGGAEIDCAGTGQDGELQEGLARAYIDNGDGTITDTRTGLTWEKLSDDDGIHDKDDSYTWADAFGTKIAALNGAHFAGHDDWRLPNVNELQSLVDYGAAPPMLSGAFNMSCEPGCTLTTCSCPEFGPSWSSTSNHFQPSSAWYVNFGDADVGNYPKSLSASSVRAVRGGS